MYAVVINEGPMMADDNAVYFTQEKPVYEAIEVQASDGEGQMIGYPVKLRFVAFTPTNGPRKNKLMRVPLERVVSITEGE